MSSYFIALIEIHDPLRYEKYLAGFNEVFEKHRKEASIANIAIITGRDE